MANENEIIQVLDEDEEDDDAVLGEILELIPDENGGNPEPPTLQEQLDSFRQDWHRELGSQGPDDSRGSPAARGSPAPRDSPAPRSSPVPKSSPAPRNSPAPRGSPAPGSGQKSNAPSAPGSGSDAKMDSLAVTTSGSNVEGSRQRDVEVSSLLTESVEEKAKYLFKQGVKHERNGRMYEAVMFYKQAMQLVPDVESRVEESEGNSRTGSNQVSDDEDDDNDDAIDEITIKLQVMTTNDLRTTCSPKTPQTAAHISALPIEVLLYILRWVVTSDLDLRSLEQVSTVSRGFYVCCRDSEIWRKACVKIWGKKCYLMKEYYSWREMFIHRPHPHFNGIYISRVTYIRPGEPSMDSFYKPWHIVEYHRFLRVFPDGTLMLVSSSDDPQSVVSKMQKNYNIPGRMIGRYCIIGDVLTAVLEKEKVKEQDSARRYIRHRAAQQNPPESEQSFELELGITSFAKRPNTKLNWKRYACHTVYRSTGNENTIEFDMNHQFYPFYFSRVKSYTGIIEAPL